MSKQNCTRNLILDFHADTRKFEEAFEDLDLKLAMEAWREPINHAVHSIAMMATVCRKDVSYKMIFDAYAWPVVVVLYSLREEDYERFWEVLDRIIGKRFVKVEGKWIQVE